MGSLEPSFLERQPISQALIRTIRLTGEYKGKQDLFKRQAPRFLEELRTISLIHSTESSNRIEGVVAPSKRIRELVAEKTRPQNRSEQEIAGYRDVLNTIHLNAGAMAFSPGLVLQLHRDLYAYSPARGGQWKSVDNVISERRADGTMVVRFQPVPAHQTGDAMERLHQRVNELFQSGAAEPLLVIPSYILDFLCIHPFLDGNGRMARLLSLLLLYRAGYEVGRYISLEQIVEQTSTGYYHSLYTASQGWHEGRHNILPWWEYFLGVVVLGAYRQFEERVGQLRTTRGAKQSQVKEALDRLPQRFSVSDLERACPGVSRATINRVLRERRLLGHVACIKTGRDATWEKMPGGVSLE